MSREVNGGMGFVKVVERKVSRTTSGSYVISLPKDWCKSIEELEGKSLEKVVMIVGKVIVILPPNNIKEEVARIEEALKAFV